MSSLFAFETLYCFLSILCVIKLKQSFLGIQSVLPFMNSDKELELFWPFDIIRRFLEKKISTKNMFVVWVPKKASNECCYCQRIEIICNGIFVPKNTLLLGKIADVEIMLFFWFCFYISCQLLM